MHEIRIHGRGGQGAVVASKVLAVAGLREGKYVQGFPSFGAERRGAPVGAFVRFDDKPVMLRTEIHAPDGIVILDPSLITLGVDVTAGLKKNGWILVNSENSPDYFDQFRDYRVATVNASKIAVKYGLGSKTAPIVNTAILGAFARFTGIVGIESVIEAIKESVPGKKEENAEAAREASNSVKGDKL